MPRSPFQSQPSMQQDTSESSQSRKGSQSRGRMPAPLPRPVVSQHGQYQYTHVNNQTESANNPNEAYNLPIDFYPLEELRRVQALVGIYSHEVPNNAHGHFPDVAMFMGSSPHSRPLHVNPSLLHDSAPAYQMSDSAHSHSLEGNPYPLVLSDTGAHHHRDQQDSSSSGNTTQMRSRRDHPGASQQSAPAASEQHFRCNKPNCDYSTNRSDLFQRHNKSSIHDNIQSCVCQYNCGKTTSRGDNMQQHERTCKNNPNRPITSQKRDQAKK